LISKHVINMNMYKKGNGLLNYTINKLPFELHIPGYQYCGPGTKLEKRLARGDPGINPLDVACKAHDIACHAHSNGRERTKADQELSTEAWKRVTSNNASIGERTAALAIAAAMKAKIGMAKTGGGLRKKIKKKRVTKTKTPATTKRQPIRRKKKCCSFKSLVSKTKKQIKATNPKTADDMVKAAMSAAKEITIQSNGVVSGQPRIIPIPKSGGVLPLVPIFAGLSALGSLAGGASAIYNALRSTKESRQGGMGKNGITIGKSARGEGVYLRPYKKGYGIYLKPYVSKSKNY
jgi:hypothetical protein